ncbi:MAG: helix-turn-helix domain-containing protein [Roseburia sp.]|nr:helix-turn-helix domain-containing protein [Roseburia sp.]
MVERILQLINQSGLRDYAFERQLGFAQGTIANWRNGRNKLSSDAVIKIANYFNISADYLLGLTDELMPVKKVSLDELPTAIAEVSQDKEFVNSVKLYNAMNDMNKQQVNTFILGVATGSGLDIKKIINKK